MPKPTGRTNQRRRTRKDLLAAAARLLKQGEVLDMDRVAAEAMVSRATVYRYFPSIEALVAEAPLDGLTPTPESLFDASTTDDPARRIDLAEAALHRMCVRHGEALRAMLAATLTRQRNADAAEIPVRQNRRAGLIDAALEPARGRLTAGAYERLAAALAVYFGPEAMVVFEDVLGMDAKQARRVKSWAVQALVHAALEESGGDD